MYVVMSHALYSLQIEEKALHQPVCVAVVTNVLAPLPLVPFLRQHYLEEVTQTGITS